MTAYPEGLAEAALDLLGCPFRLHGRDPATGLDCVGLVVAALAASGGKPVAPTGYGLRNLGIEQWLPLAVRSGLAPASGPLRSGDVILIALANCQHHLAIAADAGAVVHAHAGLRCVVRQPADPDWHILARWRATRISEG